MASVQGGKEMAPKPVRPGTAETEPCRSRHSAFWSNTVLSAIPFSDTMRFEMTIMVLLNDD